MFLAALVGCAGHPAPAPAPSSGAKEKRAAAVAQAAEYCRKKGLAMRSSAADTPTRPGQVASELEFRCVKVQ